MTDAAGMPARFEICERLTITCRGRKAQFDYRAGDTLFEAARRAGLRPPCSCLAGHCGTCMALVTEGSAAMRVNDVLTADEVAAGYVVTCQAVPTSRHVSVLFET